MSKATKHKLICHIL